jgi:hypothetical protein
MDKPPQPDSEDGLATWVGNGLVLFTMGTFVGWFHPRVAGVIEPWAFLLAIIIHMWALASFCLHGTKSPFRLEPQKDPRFWSGTMLLLLMTFLLAFYIYTFVLTVRDDGPHSQDAPAATTTENVFNHSHQSDT